MMPIPELRPMRPALRNEMVITETRELDCSSAVEVALEPVCKIVCPNRWPARLLLFLVVVVSVTLAVASIWFYKLQRFYRTSWFVVYLVALAVFIMLVLWCDPYWQSQHLLILACLMAFVIGVVFVRALLQRNASQFP